VESAGGKSVEESVKAVNRLHKTLVERGWIRDLGIEVSVENIVASAKLGYTLDIKSIAETLEHTIYEPDIFPAVIYYHQSPRATMLISRNSKVIITGVKKEK
jgi:transcription initiation factor TFIID TATA-box-binding protein